MSSRSIRRLLAERAKVEELRKKEENGNVESDDSDNDYAPQVAQRKSGFAGLTVSSDSEPEHSKLNASSDDEQYQEVAAALPADKKKNKKKKKDRKPAMMDEVEWSVQLVNQLLGYPPEMAADDKFIDEKAVKAKKLFSITSDNINVNVELGKVFGEEEGIKKSRTGTRQKRHEIGLSPNVPQIRVKGLAMVRYRVEDDIKYFRFEHNQLYRTHCHSLVQKLRLMPFTQRRLENNLHPETCAEALIENSDFLYMIEEHTGAKQLLEQSIYFMQSVGEQSFNFVDGKTRLEYKFVENRPFHIAILKYLHVLSNTACHRTALELAKVLLNLDPSDPLAVIFIIDTLAIRAREFKWLVDLIDFWRESRQAHRLFHMQYSRALALFHIACKKNDTIGVDEASKALVEAIKYYPKVASMILEFTKITVPETIKNHNIFKQPQNVPVSNILDELMELYAKLIGPRWREPLVSKWFIAVIVDLTHNVDNSIRMQGEFLESAKFRSQMYRKLPIQIKRHLHAIKPLAKYICDGLAHMPTVLPTVSFNPYPDEDECIDVYRYFPDFSTDFEEHQNALLAFIQGIYPNVYQNGELRDELYRDFDYLMDLDINGNTYVFTGPRTQLRPLHQRRVVFVPRRYTDWQRGNPISGIQISNAIKDYGGTRKLFKDLGICRLLETLLHHSSFRYENPNSYDTDSPDVLIRMNRRRALNPEVHRRIIWQHEHDRFALERPIGLNNGIDLDREMRDMLEERERLNAHFNVELWPDPEDINFEEFIFEEDNNDNRSLNLNSMDNDDEFDSSEEEDAVDSENTYQNDEEFIDILQSKHENMATSQNIAEVVDIPLHKDETSVKTSQNNNAVVNEIPLKKYQEEQEERFESADEEEDEYEEVDENDYEHDDDFSSNSEEEEDLAEKEIEKKECPRALRPIKSSTRVLPTVNNISFEPWLPTQVYYNSEHTQGLYAGVRYIPIYQSQYDDSYSMRSYTVHNARDDSYIGIVSEAEYLRREALSQSGNNSRNVPHSIDEPPKHVASKECATHNENIDNANNTNEPKEPEVIPDNITKGQIDSNTMGTDNISIDNNPSADGDVVADNERKIDSNTMMTDNISIDNNPSAGGDVVADNKGQIDSNTMMTDNISIDNNPSADGNVVADNKGQIDSNTMMTDNISIDNNPSADGDVVADNKGQIDSNTMMTDNISIDNNPSADGDVVADNKGQIDSNTMMTDNISIDNNPSADGDVVADNKGQIDSNTMGSDNISIDNNRSADGDVADSERQIDSVASSDTDNQTFEIGRSNTNEAGPSGQSLQPITPSLVSNDGFNTYREAQVNYLVEMLRRIREYRRGLLDNDAVDSAVPSTSRGVSGPIHDAGRPSGSGPPIPRVQSRNRLPEVSLRPLSIADVGNHRTIGTLSIPSPIRGIAHNLLTLLLLQVSSFPYDPRRIIPTVRNGSSFRLVHERLILNSMDEATSLQIYIRFEPNGQYTIIGHNQLMPDHDRKH